jgi:hypothetical protein
MYKETQLGELSGGIKCKYSKKMIFQYNRHRCTKQIEWKILYIGESDLRVAVNSALV